MGILFLLGGWREAREMEASKVVILPSQVPIPTFWGEPDSHAVCRMIFSFPVEFEDGHTD